MVEKQQNKDIGQGPSKKEAYLKDREDLKIHFNRIRESYILSFSIASDVQLLQYAKDETKSFKLHADPLISNGLVNELKSRGKIKEAEKLQSELDAIDYLKPWNIGSTNNG
jgi:hypothetical protein